MALCSVAAVLVGWRLILPLGVMYIRGVGVELPLPKGLATAYPRLAIFVFMFGGPILFVGLLVALVWLLRLK